MQSHECTKYFIIRANFRHMNAKQKEKNWHLFNVFVSIDKVFLVSHVFMSCLTHVSVQNFQSEHFDCAKELAFRKSVSQKIEMTASGLTFDLVGNISSVIFKSKLKYPSCLAHILLPAVILVTFNQVYNIKALTVHLFVNIPIFVWRSFNLGARLQIRTCSALQSTLGQPLVLSLQMGS